MAVHCPAAPPAAEAPPAGTAAATAAEAPPAVNVAATGR